MRISDRQQALKLRVAKSFRSPENHVIPAKAGTYCVPDQRWAPAFAGATTFVIFISLGGSKANTHIE
ncbi:hypothetical protein SBA2_550013 [Acidobacteriia bacterium SbA2]|nr:hypothetical protein SBA2_550013 [Acidobacteriia bacterium SbA2]